MKLEHFGMAEPGDCRVVFTASAQELEEAIAAEQAGENPPADEEEFDGGGRQPGHFNGILTPVVRGTGGKPQAPSRSRTRTLNCWPSTGPRDSGPGRSSSACRRWS